MQEWLVNRTVKDFLNLTKKELWGQINDRYVIDKMSIENGCMTL